MIGDLVGIFSAVILPMLLLAGVGYAVQRTVGLDLATLTRLNFQLVVPAVVLVAIIGSDLRGALPAVGFTVLVMAGSALVTLGSALAVGIPRDRWRALVLSTCFWNTGNFSLPLQDLAWRAQGLSTQAMGVQSFVMVAQNLLHFTIGTALVAGGSSWRARARAMLGFTPLWATAAAVLVVAVRATLDDQQRASAAVWCGPLWDAVLIAAKAFMAVALVTMGAQLATVREGLIDRESLVVAVVRLVAGPALGLAAAWLMGLSGWLAQVLIISTAAPVAINSVLLCVQFNQHPGLVSRCVLITTLVAPVTATLVIWLVRLLPG